MSPLLKLLKNRLFGFALTAFITFSLALPLLHAVNLAGEAVVLALYALLFAALISAYSLLPLKVRFLVPLLTLTYLILSAILFKGSFAARVLSLGRSLGSGVGFYQAMNLYNDALLPALVLVFALFARLIMEGEPGFALPLLTVPVFMLWFLGGRDKVLVFFPAVMSLPLLYVYTSHHEKEGLLSQKPKAQLTRALVLVLALSLLAFSLTPKQKETKPQFEQLAKDIKTRLEDLFFFTATRNMFTLDSQGYQPMGERGLGGRPDISLKPVMTVKADNRVYLRATALDTYTGRNWYDSLSQQRYGWQSARYDSLKKQLFDIDLPQNERFEVLSADITLLSDMPSTLFVPQRLRALTTGADMVPYYNASSELFITHDLRNGDSYSVRYEPYIAGERRTDALAARLNAGLSPSPDEVIKSYTALPEHLPPDGLIAELALQIVGNETDRYAQAMRVMRYLQQNYAYTIEVPNAPVNQDFAAHFLFELKEGYCTYFATAMTVLARSLGLPARYVEGFLADPQGQGSVTLNGTNAHAWTEIFFPHIGWVVFDATAQPGQNNNQNDNNDNQGNQSPQSDPSPSPSPSPSPEPEEEPVQAPTPTPPPPQDDPSPAPSEMPQNDGATPPEERPPFPWWILLILAFIGLFAWRVRAGNPLRREKRLKTKGAALLMYWQELLLINQANHQGILPHETPLSYAQRVNQGQGQVEAAGLISALIYGQKEPDRTEVNLLRDLYLSAFKSLKWIHKPGLLLCRVVNDLKAQLKGLQSFLKRTLNKKPGRK